MTGRYSPRWLALLVDFAVPVFFIFLFLAILLKWTFQVL